MLTAEYAENYRRAWHHYFIWRSELSVLLKIALAFAFACLTGIMAQIAFRLPWTPVPVTGQTFAVLLGGILLGRNWGGISQILYAGFGITFIPWFSGWSGGISVIAGPTGGYLVGFILAAFFLGHFVDGKKRSGGLLAKLALLFFANFVIIHGFGLLQLYIWQSILVGGPSRLWNLLMTGTVPFIIGDIMKVIGVAIIAQGITPRKKTITQ